MRRPHCYARSATCSSVGVDNQCPRLLLQATSSTMNGLGRASTTEITLLAVPSCLAAGKHHLGYSDKLRHIPICPDLPNLLTLFSLACWLEGELACC